MYAAVAGDMAAAWAAGSRTNAYPLSYGTFSHLCPSVAQESAFAWPSMSPRRVGLAAAHSPNAPSTWTHAVEHRSRTSSIAEPSGSDEPVFTLPAWRTTIVGPSDGGRATASPSRRIRPWPSLSTVTTRVRPRPRNWSAVGIVACVSDPTITVIGALRSDRRPRRPSRRARGPRGERRRGTRRAPSDSRS